MNIHSCGGGLAFLGFAVSMIIGLQAENSFVTIVIRSVLVLVIFYPLGCILAALGQKVVRDHFEHEIEERRKNSEAEEQAVSEVEPVSAEEAESVLEPAANTG